MYSVVFLIPRPPPHQHQHHHHHHHHHHHDYHGSTIACGIRILFCWDFGPPALVGSQKSIACIPILLLHMHIFSSLPLAEKRTCVLFAEFVHQPQTSKCQPIETGVMGGSSSSWGLPKFAGWFSSGKIPSGNGW